MRNDGLMALGLRGRNMPRRTFAPATVRLTNRTGTGMQGLGATTYRRRILPPVVWTPPQNLGTPADASPHADLDRLSTGTRTASLRTNLYNNATAPSYERTDLQRLVEIAESDGVSGLGSWLSSGKLNGVIGAVASVIPGGSTIANAILPQPQQQTQAAQQQTQQQSTPAAQPEGGLTIGGVHFSTKEVVTYTAIGGLGLVSLVTLIVAVARK